ncbi:hypothetical protein L0F63_003054, partial [Massospora cicadina]
DSPLWFRGYAKKPDCTMLRKALDMLGANRMVMGHTITNDNKIHSICNGQALLIDVGLSRVYGKGHSAALVLTNDHTLAIYPSKILSLPHFPGIECHQ